MVPRTNLPVALVAAGFLIAACGSSTTPAPSTAGPAGSAAPTAAASQAARSSGPSGASTAPGATGPAGSETGASVFGSAADNLDKLSSYKFSVQIQTVTITKSSPAPTAQTSTTAMSGTVINSPSKAYSLTMQDGASATGIVVIGSDAWIKQGTTFQPVPAAMADTFAQTFALYRPEKLFALAFGVNGDRFSRVGEESRNGVTCIHYKGDDSLSSVYATMFGVNASFSSDVWIAKDGAYIVSSEIKTSGSDASGGGSYSSVVNITDINSSANKVDKPA